MVNDNTANAQEAKEKEIEAIKSRKPRMAICYDFDKTLSPDDMQTFTLIPSFEIDAANFWEESNKLAKENLMETNLAWMYQLLHYSKFKRKSIRKEYFREIGKDVALYKGVEDWFDRMDKYAEKQGIILEHYIISSGLKEIIEGSRIADKFKRIYASSYYYTPDGVAEWPAQAVKSSINLFTKSNITQWLKDLISDDVGANEYSIHLIGSLEEKANVFINVLRKYQDNEKI